MRLVFLGTFASTSGAPLLLLDLLQSLKNEKNLEFSNILLDGGDLLDLYKSSAPTLVLDDSSLRNRVLRRLGWHDYLRLRKCLAFLGQRAPDLLYANTVVTLRLALQLKKALPGVSVICACHELEMGIDSHVGLANFSELAKQVDLFIVPSKAVQDYLVKSHGVAASKTHHVWEFIKTSGSHQFNRESRDALRLEYGIPPDAFVVGSCGTADWRKSPSLMIQIAGKVGERSAGAPIYFMWLGGSADQHKELQYDIARLGLSNVILVEARPDISRYFSAWDIFLLTSREEPFGLVCLHAGVHGLPTICFDKAGGAPEFVLADAGFVAPYLDLDFVVEKINLFRSDRQLVRSMGECARQRVLSRHNDTNGPKHTFEVVQGVVSRKFGSGVA